MLDRDRIVQATDLPALADELLGPRRGTSRSPTWACPSPEHAQTGRTPPVSVFRARSGEERWHCHGCGIGGSAVDLVMVARGVRVPEALEDLGSRVGVREPYSAPGDPPFVRATVPAGPPGRTDGDLVGLASYVDDCARRLWRPDGRPVLRWLTESRGLPEEVLRQNRIGADRGRRYQDRPDGMPASGCAAVLPIHEDGRVVFAQLRALNPLPGRPRYLNAATRLAPNPRVGFYEPIEPLGSCVVVTEGVLDALSANAAGFRAAALLGATLSAPAGTDSVADDVAARLAGSGASLVVAFDADEAGQRGAGNLLRHLHENGRRAARVHVPVGVNDLNAWMRQSRDWPQTLRGAVRTAVTVAPQGRCLTR